VLIKLNTYSHLLSRYRKYYNIRIAANYFENVTNFEYLVKETDTPKFSIEEIKHGLKSGNALYNSI
jgi:hypothetical protein